MSTASKSTQELQITPLRHSGPDDQSSPLGLEDEEVPAVSPHPANKSNLVYPSPLVIPTEAHTAFPGVLRPGEAHCRSLDYARDDKGRAVTFREGGDLDGRS